MSQCERREKLDAYHDGELPAEERREVGAHLRACPECAAELEELRRLSRFFASARLPEIPAEALERLHRGRGRVIEVALVRTSEYFAAAAAVIILGCAALLLHARASAAQSADPLPAWQITAVAPQTDMTAADEPETAVAQVIATDLTR